MEETKYVYIVMFGNYEGIIEAVYDTKEGAEAFIERRREGLGYDCDWYIEKRQLRH